MAPTIRARGLDIRSSECQRQQPLRRFVHIPAEHISESLFLLPEKNKATRAVSSTAPRGEPDQLLVVYQSTDEGVKEHVTALLSQKGYSVIAEETSKYFCDCEPSTAAQGTTYETPILWAPSPAVKYFHENYYGALRNNAALLDLGCGTGRDSIYMALNDTNHTFSQFVAVDRTPGALKHLKLATQHYGVSSCITPVLLNIRECDSAARLRALSSDGGYDVVLLSRFPYSREVYVYASTLVLPGGYLVINQFHTESFQMYQCPKLQHCICEGQLEQLCTGDICTSCQQNALALKCGRSRKCGFGAKAFSVIYTGISSGLDGRPQLLCILRKHPRSHK